MLFEQLAQLADFEWFGGGTDNRRECRLHCWTGLCGVHGTATMQNQAGLSSQNCTITNLQAPLGCGPIALGHPKINKINSCKAGVSKSTNTSIK
jgi:hypothetical protein